MHLRIYQTIQYACVAQLVVQLIRNEQVACSSHVTSSIYKIPLNILFSGIFLFLQSRFSYNTEMALLPYAAYTRFNIYKWSAFIFGRPFLLYHDKFFWRRCIENPNCPIYNKQ